MSELAQVVALALAKISVCLSVQRVLAKTTYSFSFLPRTLIGVIIVFHTLHFCLFALYCRPMQAIWDPLVPGNCYSVQTIVKISYAVTALDIFTDLLCAGLPVFVISRLQMNKKSKAAICILVSLGILTACSAVGKAVTYGDFRIEDASWTATTPALWVVAESQLSMNLPSFPAMRSLYLHLRQPTKGGRTDPKSLQRNDHHRLLDKLNYKVYNSSLPEGDHNPTFHTSEQLERDVENNHHLTGRITIRS
ncbi:MAG: hypothetical protein MMC33_008478 [Icmadophila ericetorum]|nr:hypothetical protein [Icmadophila ericetorum]